jgi:hypothetical protein
LASIGAKGGITGSSIRPCSHDPRPRELAPQTGAARYEHALDGCEGSLALAPATQFVAARRGGAIPPAAAGRDRLVIEADDDGHDRRQVDHARRAASSRAQ